MLGLCLDVTTMDDGLMVVIRRTVMCEEIQGIKLFIFFSDFLVKMLLIT